MKEKKTCYTISEKGIAILAAVQSGLVPKIKVGEVEGYDNELFLKFWDLFTTSREEQFEKIEPKNDRILAGEKTKQTKKCNYDAHNFEKYIVAALYLIAFQLALMLFKLG